MKTVYVLPGFMASDLGILATGQVLWWDPSLATVLGLGAMRLAPNGIDPGPPDGLPIAVDADPQNPWPFVLAGLRYQLDAQEWRVAFGSYDWRLDLEHHGLVLADTIRRGSTIENPATIVAHSAGGLVAVLAWRNLVDTAQEDLIRRIITICTPFQGSYAPLQWLSGELPTMVQLLAVAYYSGFVPVQAPIQWSLRWLNDLALTWPMFYQLYPSLIGSEAATDPLRSRLYDRSNYPSNALASQTWLDYVRNRWQPLIAGPATFPPAWVATYVYSTGIATANTLNSTARVMNLDNLGRTMEGDGIVTKGSATRSPGLLVEVTGAHASVPLGITTTGLLADLIRDPRGPITPPPPPIVVPAPFSENVTDPPQADMVTWLTCLGGG